MTNRKPTAPEREAARWLVLLDDGNPNTDDIGRFQAWLAADPSHKRAYEAMSATSDKIDAFLARNAVAGAQVAARPQQLRSRSTFLVGGVLSGLIAVCVVFAVARAFDPFSAADAYTTAPRRERVIHLSDGTQVEMGPGVRLDAAYSSRDRRVRFGSGIALFNVTSDAARPFIVSTPYGDIRATTGAFVVRIEDDRTIATILSGRLDAHASSSWPLLSDGAHGAGSENAEIILSTDHISVAEAPPALIERRLIWRRRMVALDGQPLRDAVVDIERFSGVHFAFTDDATAALRLTGYLAGDDVAAFLRLLATNVQVGATRRSDGTIVLQRTLAHTPAH